MKHSLKPRILALVVVALATSCSKDGKFNPSEKISHVGRTDCPPHPALSLSLLHSKCPQSAQTVRYSTFYLA